MQFYAVEIARYVPTLGHLIKKSKLKGADSRNRAGLNDWVYEKAQKASS